ncbi:FHA domain-containing protein [Microbacterium sp. USHLN186]|uniref:FHA domain-containing protein n=1 Tax=Microbacterium sp. USHLN186 TaxID=3081286 RepID=UPI003019B625
MNEYTYRPGTWQVVVEDAGLIAVSADAPAERVDALHRMLRGGAVALTDVIDVLAAGSLSTLGSFAVVLTDAAAARIAVRGQVTVGLSAADGDESVSGGEVSTWVERVIAAPRAFELTLEPDTAPTTLPIRSGVVLASVVRGALAEATAPAPTAPEPAAAEPAAAEPATPEVEHAAPRAGEASEFHTLMPTEFTFASEAEATGDGPQTADADLPDATVQVAPAPVASEAVGPAVASPSGVGVEDLGDHDGSTISLAELRRLRGEGGAENARVDTAALPATAAEQIVRDDAAPEPATPAADGAEQDERQTAAPDAPTALLPTVGEASGGHGVARLSTGQTLALDRTVIIGRRPRSTRASGESMPHLVAVESPQQDISRSHLEIRPEGDSVVVIDLHTTNGSTLLRPGADPVRLHPGEHTLVLTGDVVDLGDGVTVSFEGLT